MKFKIIFKSILMNDVSKKQQLYIGDNLKVLKQLEENSIDLVVTSPPYDDLRSYKGNYSLDLFFELHYPGFLVLWQYLHVNH